MEIKLMWERLNEIEEVSYKFDGVASVLKIIAENISENDTSSALWLCAEVIEERAEKISELVSLAMSLNKNLEARIQTLSETKGKRK